MACFTAPLAEALVISAVRTTGEKPAGNPFVRRIGWLRDMLFGGSLLLAIEHVWHGEITWRFPFLTAVRNGEVSGMLHEIATVGVAMAILVTAAWAVAVLVAEAVAHRRVANAAEAGA